MTSKRSGREGMDWKSCLVFVGILKAGDVGRKIVQIHVGIMSDVEDVSKKSRVLQMTNGVSHIEK